MRIVVLAKAAPDTYGERLLDLETGLAVRVPAETVLDEPAARALEAALSLAAGTSDAHVTLLMMGPSTAMTALRKGLAMGADDAVLVDGEVLAGADIPLTADVLAGMLGRIDHDLVIAGDASTDGASGALPAMLAELLGVPALTALDALEIDDGVATAKRTIAGAVQTVSCPLPAVVSVTERFPEPRLPGITGIVAAKKKEIVVVDPADLGFDDEAVLSDPRSIMITVARTPPRVPGTKVVDDGDGGRRLADFLAARGLV